MTGNYELALAIRALNARIAQLTPSQQREIQDDWNASWGELQRQRAEAKTPEAALVAVERWQERWTERLT
jgi:hypothetical protein